MKYIYFFTCLFLIIRFLQVILSVVTNSQLQTIVNTFLINLALADILVLILCAPFSILQVKRQIFELYKVL